MADRSIPIATASLTLRYLFYLPRRRHVGVSLSFGSASFTHLVLIQSLRGSERLLQRPSPDTDSLIAGTPPWPTLTPDLHTEESE